MEKTESFVVINKVDQDTGEVTRPVVRRVEKRDGKFAFIQSERILAPSLAAFRDRFPDIRVEGAPTQDEVNLLVADMTDEELAAIGLQRAPADPVLSEDLFASQDAYRLAVSHGFEDADFEHILGQGGGRGGLFNTSDVRDLLGDDEE